MNGVSSPFLITLGIISFRWFKQVGQGPPPISLAGAAVIFGACGALEKVDHKFGTTLAWGFLLAAAFSPSINNTTVAKIAGDPAGSVSSSGTVGSTVGQGGSLDQSTNKSLEGKLNQTNKGL